MACGAAGRRDQAWHGCLRDVRAGQPRHRLAFARETPRLRFNAVEPGFSPGSRLGRDAGAALQFVSAHVLSPLAPVMKYWSTPESAAQVITTILTGDSTATGMYYNENGTPMLGSAQVRDPEFNDRVVAETRALLTTV